LVKCGEIDILEYVGGSPIWFYFFYTQDSHGNTINTKKNKFEDIEDRYHIYAMDWSKDKIDFLVELVYTLIEHKTEAICLTINLLLLM
jgi:beta-glucanase (GH16 family)